MRRIAVVVAVAALCACNRQVDLSPKIVDLELADKRAATNFSLLEQRLRALEERPAQSGPTRYAIIDPAASKGYATIATSVTPLLVEFDRVEPNADGAKAYFRVGNPGFVAFSGGSVKMIYGPREPEDQEKAKYWGKSLKTLDVSFTERLREGSWTRVEVAMPGVKPGDLGYLAVSFDVDQLQLKGL